MLSRRGKKQNVFFNYFFWLFVIGLALFPRQVFCYDTNVAHPNIVGEAAEVFNKKYGNILTTQEIEWLKTGAREEDTPTRWVNHFYDPIHNTGLKGKNLSAKDWVSDSKAQANFSLGDKTWQRALDDWNKGDREDALKELGHVLHLVADMSVPAHTRDDIHAVPPDSYESFVKENWNILLPQFKDKETIILPKNLSDAFEISAKYSNGNFYSDSTIEDEKYKIPENIIYNKIKINNKNFLLGVIEDDIKLVVKDGAIWKSGEDKFVKNSIILISYSTHLIPQAIAHDAGVIKLFFNEAQKRSEFELSKKRITLLGKSNQLIGALVTAGENILDKISGTYDKTKIFIANLVKVENAVTPAQGTVPDTLAGITINNFTAKNDLPSVSQTTAAAKPTIKYLPKIITKNIQTVSDSVVASVDILPTESTPLISSTTVIATDTAPAPQFFYSNGGSSVPNQVLITSPEIFSTSTAEITSVTTTTTTTLTTTTTIISTTTTLEIVTTTIETSTTTPEVVTTTLEITTSTPTVSTTPEISTSTPTSTPTTTTTLTPEITTTTPTSTFSSPIVINEIAWAGTSVSYPTDEWLEFYNTTDQDIVFASSTSPKNNWSIKVGDKKIGFERIKNSIIPAHGYYILERNREDTVMLVSADIIYSLQYGLKNSGENIELIDPTGTVVDAVYCSSSGWFAGDNEQYRTMERINTNESGDIALNWQTSAGPRFGPRSYNGGPIYGSPKMPNLNKNISLSSMNDLYDNSSLTLVKRNNPYVLNTTFTVPANKTLNLEPGVVIKAPNGYSKIYVYGTLNVNGTETEKVFITSGRDQNLPTESQEIIAGNTSTSTPVVNDWEGLQFYAGSTGNIAGLEMRYAGSTFTADSDGFFYYLRVSEGIRSVGANLNISNSVFTNNGTTALYLKQSTTTITNSVFSQGDLAIEYFGDYLKISDSAFSGFKNANGPLKIKGNYPELSNLQLQDNVKNEIDLSGATIPVILVAPTKTEEVTTSTTENMIINPEITIFEEEKPVSATENATTTLENLDNSTTSTIP